jgi:hypothetical protein
MDKRRRCGAKTRQGTPCRKSAMPNGRCLNHGGGSTGPRVPRTTHGIYAKVLLDDDLEVWDQAALDNVDAHIRMKNVMLVRAHRRLNEVEATATDPQGKGFIVESTKQEQGVRGGRQQVRSEIVRRRPNYLAIIHDLTLELLSLHRCRIEMLESNQGRLQDPDELARQIRSSLVAIDTLTAPKGDK